MRFCNYIYCKSMLSPEHTDCPHCGYPSDETQLHDTDFLLSLLPDLGLEKLIDMHQIIPKKEGNLDLQMKMIEALSIESLLLQSVPNKVTSLYNNQDLRDLKAKHPQLFHISQFSDPRIPFVKWKLKKYAAQNNRVIKILPCLGFEPDSSKYDKFWGAMEELGLVVMTHTGFITARHKAEEKKAGLYLNSKYCRPIFFDRVARKFPSLQIILCHMGGNEWVEEACQMVTQHENVWGDISGPGIWALKRIIRLGIEVDWRKIFWGNDSAAHAYPFNLRMQHRLLTESPFAPALPYVFYQNGANFIAQYLAPST